MYIENYDVNLGNLHLIIYPLIASLVVIQIYYVHINYLDQYFNSSIICMLVN